MSLWHIHHSVLFFFNHNKLVFAPKLNKTLTIVAVDRSHAFWKALTNDVVLLTGALHQKELILIVWKGNDKLPIYLNERIAALKSHYL